MEQPLVSIIVQANSQTDKIKTCIESLLAQTLKEIEIICVCNATAPMTAENQEYLGKTAAGDSRLRLIDGKVDGEDITGIQRGLMAAKGLYIGFSHHAMTHHANMYETLYNASGKGNATLVLSGEAAQYAKKIDTDNYGLLQQIINQIAGHRICSKTQTNLYQRQFVEENGIIFPDRQKYTDRHTIFFVRFLQKSINESEKSNVRMVPNPQDELCDNLDKTYNYDHTALKKVEAAIIEVDHLLRHTQGRNIDLNNRVIWEYTVRMLHACYRHEIKQRGFFAAVKLFRGIKKDKENHGDRIIAIMKHRHKKIVNMSYKMTLAEKLFAFSISLFN